MRKRKAPSKINTKRLDTIFVIYDTEDNELWYSGTKIGWVSTGAAKNAWNLVNSSWSGKEYFDNQTRYVIVPIHELLVKSLVEEKQID